MNGWIPGGYTYHKYSENKGTRDHLITIDPGTENCGFRLEQMNMAQGGVGARTISIDLKAFKAKKNKKTLYDSTYDNITAHLEVLSNYMSVVRAVVVETQLPKNTEPLKVAEYIKCYFKNVHKNENFDLLDVAGAIKRNTLTADPTIKGKKAKKWSPIRAAGLLRMDGDYAAADYVESLEKGDDAGDVVLMAECYRIYMLGHPIRGYDSM